MIVIGLEFFNSRKELCKVKTVDKHYVYIEIVDDVAHYRVDVNNFPKYLTNGKYMIATEAGKLLYG